MEKTRPKPILAKEVEFMIVSSSKQSILWEVPMKSKETKSLRSLTSIRLSKSKSEFLALGET